MNILRDSIHILISFLAGVAACYYLDKIYTTEGKVTILGYNLYLIVELVLLITIITIILTIIYSINIRRKR